MSAASIDSFVCPREPHFPSFGNYSFSIPPWPRIHSLFYPLSLATVGGNLTLDRSIWVFSWDVFQTASEKRVSPLGGAPAFMYDTWELEVHLEETHEQQEPINQHLEWADKRWSKSRSPVPEALVSSCFSESTASPPCALLGHTGLCNPVYAYLRLDFSHLQIRVSYHDPFLLKTLNILPFKQQVCRW